MTVTSDNDVLNNLLKALATFVATKLESGEEDSFEAVSFSPTYVMLLFFSIFYCSL